MSAVAPPPMVVLGLGNPGEKYAGNRHNIGAQCVSLLARKHGIRLETSWNHVRVGQGEVGGAAVVLARPRTFMNESGLAAAALVRRFHTPSDRFVALCDDLDLPLGRLRIRGRGSAAGHRGLGSIEQHLGTREFPRVRIGIGRPYPQEERSRMGDEAYEAGLVRWVLSDFTHEEEERAVREARERAVAAVECLVAEGLERAMNLYNKLVS